MPDSPALLAARWRTDADTLRRRGAPHHAEALVSCAEELEASCRERDETLLKLSEASRLSGYSSGHLGRMVRDGTIPNAGRPNAPRIRRKDLPRKAGLPPYAKPVHIADTSRTQIARSIAQGDKAR